MSTRMDWYLVIGVVHIHMEIGRIRDYGKSGNSLSVIFTWKLGGFMIGTYSHGNWEDSHHYGHSGDSWLVHIHMEIGRIHFFFMDIHVVGSHVNWENSHYYELSGNPLLVHIHMEIVRIRNCGNSGDSLTIHMEIGRI